MAREAVITRRGGVFRASIPLRVEKTTEQSLYLSTLWTLLHAGDRSRPSTLVESWKRTTRVCFRRPECRWTYGINTGLTHDSDNTYDDTEPR